MTDKPREYCGVFGVFDHPDAALLTYYGLHALQHRGQESAGIVTTYFDTDKGRNVMPMYKDFGLVLSVFDKPKKFLKRFLKVILLLAITDIQHQDHLKIQPISNLLEFIISPEISQ